MRIAWIWSCTTSQVSEYVDRFVRVAADMGPRIIVWPTGEHLAEVIEGFQRASRLPACCGAVDGCHIEIEAPRLNAWDYICYKHRYTIILQACVCCLGLFTHVYCGYPGRANDMRVFRNSGLPEILTEQCLDPNRPQTYIVGDAAYELRVHTLVAYDYASLDEAERLTTAAIDKARVKVENSFARLKNRWRCARARRRARDRAQSA